MSQAPKTHVHGTAVYVAGQDIDTDRIIPARFLKCVTFDALGEQVFYDERFGQDGESLSHPLDQHPQANILVVDRNFGCGSSREHAPQALYRWGIRAVIGVSFAEIFFANSVSLGMPCLTMREDDLAQLTAILERAPDTPVSVEITGWVQAGDQRWPATLPSSVQEAFMEGRWAPLTELLSHRDAIRATASALPYTSW